VQRILVIGFGNPYRGDDGFGILAAEQFEASNHHPEVQVEAAQELRPEFAELISRADLVLFLDASHKGVPGDIEMQPLAPLSGTASTFSHDLTPSGLLAAAQVLYGRCPKATMITVAGQDFEFGTQLSPCVRAALPGVLERLREIVTPGWSGTAATELK
jgi:hydrogenase maturation protease